MSEARGAPLTLHVPIMHRHGSSTVTYERDATDRIMSRTAGGVTLRYSYSGSGDSPDMVMTTTNSVVDKMVDLLGGVTKTTHLEANVYSDRYNYPNIHGDVMALADGSGNKVGPTKTYDPFGNPLTALIDNLTGNFDEGWLGSKDRLTESEGGINIIEMGQRQYSPKLGRFLEVDPVEGGSANDYDYCDGDPINCFDLDGTISWRKVFKTAAVVAGIAGAIACGASIVYGVAVGAAAGAAAYSATNRSWVSDNSTTYYSCYDNADRLRSSTDPTLNAIAYDAHGNTTTLGSSTMTYDLSDRHMSTTTGSTVTYERDATDRIMSRTAGGVTLRYSYSGFGDSPDMVMTTTNSVVDKMVDLLGGVTKTTHLEANVYSDRYNYPNIHGDVMLLADGNGTKQGPTKTYDPFGNPLTALIDNLTGNFDEGWLGSKDRLTETEGGINIIEMGQRQYSPKLGRFLEVDPVEGGSANDYDYCDGDPINCLDLDGTWSRKTWRKIAIGFAVVAVAVAVVAVAPVALGAFATTGGLAIAGGGSIAVGGGGAVSVGLLQVSAGATALGIGAALMAHKPTKVKRGGTKSRGSNCRRRENERRCTKQ